MALPSRNALQYHNSDFIRLNGINFSALCRILVRFSPVIPKFMITPFPAIRQKSAYHARYIRLSLTYLDLLYKFGQRIGRDDYPGIHLAVAQGTLLWQQGNLGDVCRHRQERPLLFALSFDNGSDDRKAAFKRVNGNNPSISCTKLVNVRLIISNFTLLKGAIFLPRVSNNLTTIFIRHLGVPKRIKRSQL